MVNKVNIIPTLSAQDVEYLLTGSFNTEDLTEYMRFMTLIKVMLPPNNINMILVPSKAVDAVWRHHLVHSELYSKFCTHNFDKPIHRDPTKIGRKDYVATLAKLAVVFEGTALNKLSQAHWPSDDYEDGVVADDVCV